MLAVAGSGIRARIAGAEFSGEVMAEKFSAPLVAVTRPKFSFAPNVPVSRGADAIAVDVASDGFWREAAETLSFDGGKMAAYCRPADPWEPAGLGATFTFDFNPLPKATSKSQR